MADIFLTRNGYGGAIFANIVDCRLSIFKNNRAKNAGAIFAKILGADNVIFVNNFAINDVLSIQDAAIISSSSFINNTVEYGGIVYSHGAIIFFSSFINNTANFGAVNSPNLFVSASYFDGNFAKYGGAIFVNGTESSNFEFKDTVFTNNNAMEGGAVYIDLKIKSKFSNCNFTNNTSFGDGGVVFMQRNNEASFSQCVFTKNSALKGKGGAIYNQYGELGNDNLSVFRDSFLLFVENCTFNGNYAKDSGGAIFWTGWLVLKPFSYFDSNIADTGCGGAIYTEMFAYTIRNITFVNNFAGNTGGAINVNRLTEDIKYSNFITNHAKFGGAIYINDLYQDSTFSHCTFIHNTGLQSVYDSRCDVAIFVAKDVYPNPNFKCDGWGITEFLSTFLSISDCVLFENIASSNWCGAFIDHVEERWNFGFQKVTWVSNQFKNPNPIKMNLACDNIGVLIDEPIKVTFYLYNGADGSLYCGDGFDMNNASFDIDSGINVVNKEFNKNSVTLELCPQGFESYPIKINFYGCSLSAVLNVSPTIGAFPLINLANVSIRPIF